MNKRILLLFFLPLIFIITLGGCGGENTSRPRDSVACVGNNCLTERDIEHQIPEAYRGMVTTEEKKEYVKIWLRTEIFYQEALKEKFDKDKRIQSLVKQAVKDLVAKEFIDAELKGKIQVTPEDALSFYQQKRSMFVWPADYLRISHIFTQGMSGISLASLMLKQGEGFEDVAAKISEDEKTKKTGGDLGLIKIEDLSPEISEYVSKLKLNEISSPIHTSYGYEIFKITDRKQKGNPQEFEWAKEQIMNMLASDYRQRETDLMLKQLSEKTRIETFDWASDVKLDQAK
ncbi:MAG: peptidylprolyl isomerase [Candidatus Zixiibacteriota bacterium]